MSDSCVWERLKGGPPSPWADGGASSVLTVRGNFWFKENPDSLGNFIALYGEPHLPVSSSRADKHH